MLISRNFIRHYAAIVSLAFASACAVVSCVPDSAHAQIVNPAQPATGVPIAGTGITVSGQTVSINYGLGSQTYTGNFNIGGTLTAGSFAPTSISTGTLTATGTVSGAGFSNLFAAAYPIGSTTPNTGAFTNLAASGTTTLATVNTSGTVTNSGATVLTGAVSGAGINSYEANINHVQIVLNVAALRTTSCVPGLVYATQGYTTLADGGNATYVCNGSDTTSTDNGCNIIASASSFRYYLQTSAEISVKQCGAKGDGVTDDSLSMQVLIDYVSSLSMPGTVVVPSRYTFLVGANTVSGIATGVAGIVLKNNVTLRIDGTIRAKANIYGTGALYGVIRALDVGVSNATITGNGYVDGNSANETASTQCNNVYLVVVNNVHVDSIHSINANGNSIIITAVSGSTQTNVSVRGVKVQTATYIGIQVSHSAGNLLIADNEIDSTTNNCIDVYDENGTTTPDAGGIDIVGNVCRNGSNVGIFPETSRVVNIVGNTIEDTPTGFYINRINGAPSSIRVTGNVFARVSTGGVVTGDTAGITLTENTFDAFTVSGLDLGVGGNVSHAVVSENSFNPSTTTVPVIRVGQGSGQASFLYIKTNYLRDSGHSTSALIQFTPATAFTNTVEPLIQMGDYVYPSRVAFSGSSTSGGTTTFTVPANTAGKLVIKSSAGGAWNSVWTGSFVAGTSAVTVGADTSIYTAPGNNVSSVVGSTSTLVITITWAASGSSGNYNAWEDFM